MRRYAFATTDFVRSPRCTTSRPYVTLPSSPEHLYVTSISIVSQSALTADRNAQQFSRPQPTVRRDPCAPDRLPHSMRSRVDSQSPLGRQRHRCILPAIPNVCPRPHLTQSFEHSLLYPGRPPRSCTSATSGVRNSHGTAACGAAAASAGRHSGQFNARALP